MVTSAHEGMHRIFQERPEILTPVFEVLGVPLSEKASVGAVPTDVTEVRPLERRADTVLRIGPIALPRMDAWLERSRTVERAEDLFAEGSDVPLSLPEGV